MNIDRAVEQATNDAFAKAYEGPKPPEPSTCIVCGKEGTPTDSGWVENPELQTDPEGDYWDGDALLDAYDTRHGWVCSNRCRSQAMYDHLDDNDKKALNAVVDACRVLSEFGARALKIVNRETGDYVYFSKLTEMADDLLKSVHYDIDDPPAWLNRLTAEEELWRVAHRIMFSLNYLAVDLSIRSKIDIDSGRNYQAADEAQLTARTANLVIGLKEALNL